MRAGAVADHPDAFGIDAKLARIRADILHSGFRVIDGTGPGLHARLHQPVLDRKDRIAVLGEIRAPILVELAVADLPAPAMYPDEPRRLLEPLRRIEIAEQLRAVMLGKHDVVAHHH